MTETKSLHEDANEKQTMFAFATIPQVPPETDSEKLNRIANLVDDISVRIGDEDERKGEYEVLLNFYQQLQNKISEFNRKLDVHFEYVEALRDRMEKKQTEAENATLRKSLAEQGLKLNKANEEFRRLIEQEVSSIQSKMNGIDNEFLDKLDLLNQKMTQFGKVDEEFQKKIETFRKDMTKACENEFKILSKYSKDMLNTEKESIKTFLQECESQNSKLIKNIPKQKSKLGWYDAIYFALGGVCIASMIVGMVCR